MSNSDHEEQATMNRYAISAVTAAALTAATLGFTAVAQAAPSGPSNAQDTVKTLEAAGYNVILNRTGAAPLSECAITSVQPGQTFSTVDSRGGGSPVETVLSKTVRVDVTC
jgi:hypothetical protein